MIEYASVALSPWGTFYILIGTAAATLTGLMFIVITLVMGEERVRRSRDGISTFSTPTVVHFGVALVFSALLLAPWHSLIGPAIVLGIGSLLGLIYVALLLNRAIRFTDYEPDSEDWIWYTVLPLVAYAVIFIGAVTLCPFPLAALYAIAAGNLLLIIIGIHNAWDIVTYIAIGPNTPQDSDSSNRDGGSL